MTVERESDHNSVAAIQTGTNMPNEWTFTGGLWARRLIRLVTKVEKSFAIQVNLKYFKCNSGENGTQCFCFGM